MGLGPAGVGDRLARLLGLAAWDNDYGHPVAPLEPKWLRRRSAIIWTQGTPRDTVPAIGSAPSHDRTHLPWQHNPMAEAQWGPARDTGAHKGPKGPHKGPMALPQRLGRVPHRLLGLWGLIPSVGGAHEATRPHGHPTVPGDCGSGWAPGPATHPGGMVGHQAQPSSPKTLLPSATVLVGKRTVTLARSAFHWGVGLPQGSSRRGRYC